MRISHRASDLKLMAVGKRPLSKHNRVVEKYETEPSSNDEALEDETMPLLTPIAAPVPAQRNFSVIEDPRVSRFSHAKILLMEKNLLILTFLILFLGMIETELEIGSVAASRLLLVLDLATAFLVLLIILRKLAVFELDVDQRRLYLPRPQRNNSPDYLRLLLANREYLTELTLELLFILPHPSLLLAGLNYSVYSEAHGQSLNFSVNDLMGVLMLLKVGLIVRAIVGLSLYATPRAVRMCHYSGIGHDFVFVGKCLQQEHPLRCSAAVFGLSLLIFGYGFRVTEGQLSVLNSLPATGFESFGNCYWAAFITMATIGYGDYIPTTSLAQLLAVALAILGVVLNSQLIMALTGYLRMKVSEARSHTVLFRLQEQDLLRRQSASALVESVRLAQMMRRDTLDPLVGRKLKPRFEVLKGCIDAAKAHHKRIKSIVPTETITEEMTRSFELLKDNFKDIYNMQRKVKRKIEQMQARTDFRHDEMRRSFIDEVSNIMHKVRR